MRKENDVLTDRLAEYEDAEPKMSGSSPASGKNKAGSGVSFADAVDAAFAGL